VSSSEKEVCCCVSYWHSGFCKPCSSHVILFGTFYFRPRYLRRLQLLPNRYRIDVIPPDEGFVVSMDKRLIRLATTAVEQTPITRYRDTGSSMQLDFIIVYVVSDDRTFI
jgi:hypothetical protein